MNFYALIIGYISIIVKLDFIFMHYSMKLHPVFRRNLSKMTNAAGSYCILNKKRAYP